MAAGWTAPVPPADSHRRVRAAAGNTRSGQGVAAGDTPALRAEEDIPARRVGKDILGRRAAAPSDTVLEAPWMAPDSMSGADTTSSRSRRSRQTCAGQSTRRTHGAEMAGRDRHRSRCHPRILIQQTSVQANLKLGKVNHEQRTTHALYPAPAPAASFLDDHPPRPHPHPSHPTSAASYTL